MNDYNYFDNLNRDNSFTIENDPYSAFVKGNSFTNLYNPYKNYKPFKINPKNEKEYTLLLVQIYDFISHDLGLYLDVDPNNEGILKLRDKYIKLYNQALAEYEQKYGVLSLDNNMLGKVPWAWDKENFPWEGDK